MAAVPPIDYHGSGVAGLVRTASAVHRLECLRMRVVGVLSAIVAALGLCGCATVYNLPLNAPSADPFVGGSMDAAAAGAGERWSAVDEGTVIGLSFSGGGTRAAAFSFGVLEELARTPSGKSDLLDRVGVVSGVSGGAITAAYYGLKGRAALADFRERYLTQDLMAELQTSVNLVNLGRALGGGINTDERLRSWLNSHLYRDATFGDLIKRGRPITLINATDVYSRTPFLFAPTTFAAMCSDLGSYPVAAAVAASAAVPGAFAPVVIETFPGQCRAPLPPSLERAARNASVSPLVQAYAKSLERARSGQVKYVKLLDGGLVDNYGLSGMTIARAASGTPWGPLLPRDAMNLRRLMFLIVDSGRGPQGGWAQTVEGPTGEELISAVIDTIIDANTQTSYVAFETTMVQWRDEIVRWRCGLKPAEAARLRGHGGPWNCRDLKITVGRISFDQLDAARAKKLSDVPTSFTLPVDTVDELRRAGTDALKANPTFQAFLRDMK
jgi:predicted acylesterase/phospholipase RssA